MQNIRNRLSRADGSVQRDAGRIPFECQMNMHQCVKISFSWAVIATKKVSFTRREAFELLNFEVSWFPFARDRPPVMPIREIGRFQKLKFHEKQTTAGLQTDSGDRLEALPMHSLLNSVGSPNLCRPSDGSQSAHHYAADWLTFLELDCAQPNQGTSYTSAKATPIEFPTPEICIV
jgi:hypothetical protein